MDCLEEDAVLALVGGETAGVVDRAAADLHLADCDRCRQLVAEAMRDSSIEVLATAPASPAARSSFRSVLQYDLIRELGRGGMGTVYLAHDQELDEEVALKLLRMEMASVPSKDAGLAKAPPVALIHWGPPNGKKFAA